MKRLDDRIRRSKRSGKIVVAGVLLVSLAFAVVLIQGLFLALNAGRTDLMVRAILGLALLVGLDAFAVVMMRRQHRILDEAAEELQELVRGEAPH